ncbi:MAG: sigma-70 family RNA polymerase sigma factor [Candidatus Omnitrophica bacterium]|nr:sigma-70 family RNA polymerase sigma factor [Candidatus Omnitrophota bacterium]
MEFLMFFWVLFSRRQDNTDIPPIYDDELVDRAKQGDKKALDVLYHKYKRPILNYIYRFVGNFHHAEELAQETFVRVYMNISRYEKTGKFSSWVYTIAGNLSRNFLRDRKHVNEVSIDESITEEGSVTLLDVIQDKGKLPDEQALAEEKEKLIQQGINQLKPKHKDVIILCDIQGLPYDEVAKILKCPSQTVGSRLSRARENLARILGFKDL